MPRQYPPEFRVRALRLLDTMMEDPDVSEFDAIKSVAGTLGVSPGIGAPVAAQGPSRCRDKRF
jgi:hypothetical protein